MTVSSANNMKELVVITWILLLQQYQWLHAAPSIESCPHDSIQVEDTCKCDPKLCSKPPCPYDLNTVVNGTDTPGNCCTIYSCDGCSNDTLINGKCPCASGAILNSKGECKCDDPHKSLTNNECVCDPNLCELPQICGDNYVAVTVHEECCSKLKCIQCPVDSFATNHNDEAIENKCLCYPCKNKQCGANEKVVIMQHGKGFPGTCCDMYKCEKDDVEESKCSAEGLIYSNGDAWVTPDGQTCQCEGGISFCTKQNEENFLSCHKEGSVYKHNESWMLDSCTNCTCFNGEPKCIAHMCEISEGYLEKPECQPLNCSKVCPDGFKLNKKGCKICKCNYPYKYDDILQKYNITKNQLKDILDDYFNPGTTESNFISTTTITTNISDEVHFTTPIDVSDGCHSLDGLVWSALGFLVGVGATLSILGIIWLNRRKKGSYDTNAARSTVYERMTLTKNALCSNNNYIGNDNKNQNTIKTSV